MHRLLSNVLAMFICGLLFFVNGAISVHYFADHYSTCDHDHHSHDATDHDDECPVCDYEFASFAPFDQIDVNEILLQEKPACITWFDNSLIGEPVCSPAPRGPPQRV